MVLASYCSYRIEASFSSLATLRSSKATLSCTSSPVSRSTSDSRSWSEA
jgi:hypothetical protein